MDYTTRESRYSQRATRRGVFKKRRNRNEASLRRQPDASVPRRVRTAARRLGRLGPRLAPPQSAQVGVPPACLSIRAPVLVAATWPRRRGSDSPLAHIFLVTQVKKQVTLGSGFVVSATRVSPPGTPAPRSVRRDSSEFRRRVLAPAAALPAKPHTHTPCQVSLWRPLEQPLPTLAIFPRDGKSLFQKRRARPRVARRPNRYVDRRAPFKDGRNWQRKSDSNPKVIQLLR